MKLRQSILLLIAAACGGAVMMPHVWTEDSETTNPHARWESAIQSFEQADRKNLRPRNSILFTGSSSIRLWDLEKSFPDLVTINHGFGGSEIADTIHFADRTVWPFKPKVIVLYAGDNDIARGKSAAETAADFQTLSQLVHEQLPDTKLIYIAIKPSIRRWSLAAEMKQANAIIARTCAADDQRLFVDIWEPMLGENGQPNPDLFIKDGLHLNAAGYELWTELVSMELEKIATEPVADRHGRDR